ncbi:hypothetical protein [Paenibacillus radicis (ex Gao et al. 2016)]|uniref:Preprotein translocase subunit Tim44 n=1 Tax=Paenibacillus radicis (ex Gao et al. 2016) TaxID=1737354 RepID=A0A917HTS2_9BACL|nr:hypothetical protein [Paenibacillus radicis (ex Gao et al. 2016)]GGG88860.1 hypothetical protein GCM10010918_54380 [Paenibacillus radicis (ex Gao et al. 2016)]
MKKGLVLMLAMTLFLTLGFGQVADAAKRGGGGGMKSPKQSFTQTPKKTDQGSGVSQSNPGTKTGGAAGAGAATKSSGFGGSFMKGMLVGGLAGMLFGGMFGTGAFGQMLGFLVNLLAIAAIIMVIVAAFKYIRNKRTPNPRGPY